MNNECSERLKMLGREMGDEVHGRLSLGWTPSPAYPGRLGVAGSVLIPASSGAVSEVKLRADRLGGKRALARFGTRSKDSRLPMR